MIVPSPGTLTAAARMFAAMAIAGGAACSAGSDMAGPTSDVMIPSASLALASAPDTSVHALPVPTGLVFTAMRGLSSGYIIGNFNGTSGTGRPYAWSPPYTAPAALIATSGVVEGLDDPNAIGDVAGNMGSADPGFWSPPASDGSGWTFTPASVPSSYTSIVVSGVNTAHALSGWGWSNGVEQALWWSDPASEPTQLPWPTVSSGTVTGALATALNDAGTLVGSVNITSGRSSYSIAAVWTRQNGVWTVTLLPGGGTSTHAYDINEAGQVAGNGAGAVLWTPSGDSYTTTIVSADDGQVGRVDACGRVIGYTTASSPRAWIWDAGTITYLPTPAGAAGTEAAYIGPDPASPQNSIVMGLAQPKRGAATPVYWTVAACP